MLAITKPEKRTLEIFWSDKSKIIFTGVGGLLLLLNLQNAPKSILENNEINNFPNLGWLFLIGAGIYSLRIIPRNNNNYWLTNFSILFLTLPWALWSTRYIFTLNWMPLLVSLSMLFILLSPKLIAIPENDPDQSDPNKWQILLLASAGFYIILISTSFLSIQQTEKIANSAILNANEVETLRLLEQVEDYRGQVFSTLAIIVILTPLMAFIINALQARWFKQRFHLRSSEQQTSTEIDSSKDKTSNKKGLASIRSIILGNLIHQLDDIIDPHTAAQIAASTINHLFKNSQVTIFDYRRQTEELNPLVIVGNEMELQGELKSFDIKSGFLGRAVSKAKSQLIFDTLLDPDNIQAQGYDPRSKIVVPLFHSGTLLGAIDVSESHPNSFSQSDVSRLKLWPSN